jgi:hypothetical protein
VLFPLGTTRFPAYYNSLHTFPFELGLPQLFSLSLSLSLCTFTTIFYRSIAEAAIDTKQKHMSLNDGFRNTSTKLTGEQKRI